MSDILNAVRAVFGSAFGEVPNVVLHTDGENFPNVIATRDISQHESVIMHTATTIEVAWSTGTRMHSIHIENPADWQSNFDACSEELSEVLGCIKTKWHNSDG